MTLTNIIRNICTPNVAWNCIVKKNFERKVEIFNKINTEFKALNQVACTRHTYDNYTFEDLLVDVRIGKWVVKVNGEEVCTITPTKDDRELYSFACNEEDLDFVEIALDAFFDYHRRLIEKKNKEYTASIEKYTKILKETNV